MAEKSGRPALSVRGGQWEDAAWVSTVIACQHLRVTGKWEPGRESAVAGALVYRCDACGDVWTGGVYLTAAGPVLSPEERAELAWQTFAAERPDSCADPRVFKLGYLAALKEKP
jgi:hypothetical protein